MKDSMKQFGQSINRLIAGEDLSRDLTRDLFSEILLGEQSEIHQGAFLSAITAKGPNPKEIAGAWQAIYELDTIKVSPSIKKPLVDNCGTGMDGFKTFNISTCSAIVAAAGGVCLARHGARAITSRCGTVDICETLGVDVECQSETVQKSIEKTGIGLFNGMSPDTHPQALFRILSRMRFGSILNIAASLANPANPNCGVRGVYSREMIDPVIQTMKEIGFKKALVFHGMTGNGSGGIDELSPVGESYVAELEPDGSIVHYTVDPESVNLKNSIALKDIAAGDNRMEEALRLLRVLSGKDTGALYETVCLNAAPIFYVAEEADDLLKGVEKARDTIDSGLALDKLKQWVQAQNRNPRAGEKKLTSLLEML
ncbi:MAG: anthranilate phosphoribosyltransferase [Deltaproteobacteria bacterium]|nr:anthranilate phosphoribosyltransferase [Deltaproteobacteria bacterium]MBW2202337.1 anthranilate phosphoribosyltransferase [Deltaproteobacteria bacterium]